MFEKIFSEKYFEDENCKILTVKTSEDYSISDTLLCGQCFRYEEIENRDGYALYLVNAGGRLIFIGQKKRGELIFYGSDENELNTFLRNYFDLDTDYRKIGADIRQNFSSEFLDKAIDSASGIAILRQDPWETVCSFIISQNNNIPRIRKIIREISAAYGENLALKSGIKTCPIDIETTPCEEKCKKCGRCYTFPTAKDISENPELLLPSKPGFRYKYILDAANKINSGEIDLAKIKEANSYEVTVNELSKILGVGLKVASCAALFGFYNLDAFPIDVWMKRAIDRYFGGSLDHRSLGKYAGVAQQYIFHYIRNLNDTQNEDKK